MRQSHWARFFHDVIAKNSLSITNLLLYKILCFFEYSCNKVHCTNCGKSMCWICKKVIDGYEHFNSSRCALFPGQENMNFNFQGYNRPEPEVKFYIFNAPNFLSNNFCTLNLSPPRQRSGESYIFGCVCPSFYATKVAGEVVQRDHYPWCIGPHCIAPPLDLRPQVSCWNAFLFYFVNIFTARKRSLGQGNVFTPVCHSVHRGVCPTPP